MPALFTSTSMRFQRAVASATMRSRSWSRRTSAWRPQAVPPWPSTAATVAAIVSSLRPATRTSASSAAKRSTIARPMPRLPPVTITVFPSNRLMAATSSVHDEAAVDIHDLAGDEARVRRAEERDHVGDFLHLAVALERDPVAEILDAGQHLRVDQGGCDGVREHSVRRVLLEI